MHLSNQVFSLILLLVLIGLVIPASIALYRVRTLALPISTVTATATLLLPIITGVMTQGARSFTRRSYGDAKIRVSWSAISLMMLLLIYETVIATLALTSMTPPDSLSCQLERQWSWLFSTKNANIIRRIQDRHQCCGLNSVQDRAWPFPDRSHTAAACHEAFGRERSCFGGWRQDEQITGGLMLLVAVCTFLVKLLMFVINQSHNSSTRSSSHFAANGETSGDGAQRRIADAYHDDPTEDEQATGSQSHSEGDNQEVYASPAMQPWR